MQHRLGRLWFRVGKGAGRVGVTALSVTLMAALLAPLPVDGAPSKPKEVPPLGVKGKAPEPELERPQGNFADQPPGTTGVKTGPGALDAKDKEKGSGRFEPDGVAVEEMSSETKRVVRNRDGALNAVVTAGPVRLKDASGKWRPFDLSLARGARGLLRTQVSPVEVGFRDVVDPAAPTAEITLGEGKVLGLDIGVLNKGATAEVAVTKSIDDPTMKGYSPQDKAKVEALTAMPTKEPGKLDFAARAGLEVSLSPTPNGVKSTYTLDTPTVVGQAGAGELLERLTLPVGWSARQGEGLIEILDGSGEPHANWRGGPVSDAAKSSGLSSASMQLLGQEGQVASARVVLDAAWITDPARVLPIIIDPAVERSANASGAGAMMINSTSNASSWGDPEMYVGWNPNNNTLYRSLVTFDLAGLEGYDLNRADLHLWHYGATVCSDDRVTLARRNTSPWGPNTVWPGPSTTDAGISGNPYTNCDPQNGEIVATDVTAITSGWLQTGLNYGLTLAAAVENDHSYWKRFTSGNSWVPPRLYLSLGHRPTMANPAWPASGSVAASTTPALAVHPSSDPDGETVYYYFRISTGPDAESGQVVNSGWLAGQNIFGVPQGSLENGVTYYWHVYTSDQKPRPAGMTDEQYAQHLFNNPVFTTNPNWVWSIKIDMRLGTNQPSPIDSFGPGAVNLATGNFTTSLKTKSMPTVGGDVGLTMTYNSKAPANTGLMGTYYPDENQNAVFDEPQALRRLDARPYFDWGLDRPSLAVNTDNFMVRWNGFITMPTSGSWSLGTISDDGVRIFIDNAPDSSPFLSSWQDQGAGPLLSSGTSTFNAGEARPIRMEYYERGGYASVQLWAIRRNPDQSVAEQYPVPGSWLSPGSMAMPQGWSMSADLDGQVGYVSLRETTTAVILQGVGGDTHEYKRTASGFTPPLGEDAVLSIDPEHYTLQDSDGSIYLFARNGGHLLSATSTIDDRKPASPVYTWSGSTPRLSRMTDPVSGRSIELFYGGQSQCPGANNVPASMLCRITYWDGTETNLLYASGFLVRMVNPGNLVTDLGWNAGRLEAIRDPYSYDLLAAGVVPANHNTETHILYDSQLRADHMFAPTPGTGAGSSPLPAEDRYYTYANGYSDVVSVGLPNPSGFTRRAHYDAAMRSITEFDATLRATGTTWNNKDQVVASIDQRGMKSSTFYDHADRPVESYGPAPASYYGGDNRPNNAGPVPYGTTR
ncbi:MAG: DNRLRE domain-containing protein, partial [Acidimicrobiales bacterium]